MPHLFAVERKRGGGWDFARPMEEQADWPEHAAFMDELVTDGFIVLGGPLGGDTDVLLIVRADDQTQIESRLTADVWTRSGLLRTTSIRPWTIRLGSLS